MRWTSTFLAMLLAFGVALAEDERADAAPANEPAPAAGATSGGERASDDDAAAEPAEKPAENGPKTLSGMSVLGNREAPKSLVIVPWKSSEIGDPLGISAMLDEGRQPVDRDVFLRALAYHEIRSEGRPATDVSARANR